MSQELALHHGEPVLEKSSLKRYNTISDEEKTAALKVLESGVLSHFYGVWNEQFYGGTYVRLLEETWKKYLNVKQVVSMNSATSGLNAAIAAIGINPGDEVIVTPLPRRQRLRRMPGCRRADAGCAGTGFPSRQRHVR